MKTKTTTSFTRRLLMLASSIALMFIISLCSCLNEEGDLSYRIKVSASDHIESLDYSNIPDLDKQPLRVIRKSVEGEWRIINWFVPTNENLFVTITSDSVIYRYCESVPKHLRDYDYRYIWEIQAVDTEDEPPYNYIYRYVMRRHPEYDLPPSKLSVYFTQIQNDTLHGVTNFLMGCWGGQPKPIILLRIKE